VDGSGSVGTSVNFSDGNSAGACRFGLWR
jgi:hypothetical protein